MTTMKPSRNYTEGRGEAVANRTINRLKIDGTTEVWDDVAIRVAYGNSLLAPKESQEFEYNELYKHIRNGVCLMSGRHLQHGDESQPKRSQTVMTNCSTSCTSFMKFFLLLNGSGVGRSYDDELMVVNWANMPFVECYVKPNHADVLSGEIDRKYTVMPDIKGAKLHKVKDSREGWTKCIEMMESMAYENRHDKTIIFDFSDVRPNGSPIAGMQGRPASGPAPLMEAIMKVAGIRGNTAMPAWEQTLRVDHWLSECVLVGGVRRSARMATKSWRDAGAVDFAEIKKSGDLWTANNSITTDAEFWSHVKDETTPKMSLSPEAVQAKRLFKVITEAQYNHGSGEPGFINQDKLNSNDEGMGLFDDKPMINDKVYRVNKPAKEMVKHLLDISTNMQHKMITNPCGEITLASYAGFCVIGDVVPFHSESYEEAESAFRATVRALIRVNTMPSPYQTEVTRTNRIGVGITGLHEYALSHFGYGFLDLIDEAKSEDFWKTLSSFAQACVDEADKYSNELGMVNPHTVITVKPAGTTSALFDLTEGVHLPSLRDYLRWVQFRNDDPLVKTYQEMGYPTKQLKTYSGTTIVGFPTRPKILELPYSNKVVIAPEATPEQQYQYLMLLEKYWLNGWDGEKYTTADRANQISYTLKYDKKRVSLSDYKKIVLQYQPEIKCCSVMPELDSENIVFEYLPEEPITSQEYDRLMFQISKKPSVKEDVDFEHIDCATGACPIDFNKK